MLSSIYIKNFAIIDEKTIPFAEGFNVLSGETGAGKSILIDALGLQLGDRADSSWIRHNTNRCDILSDYHLPTDSPIQAWLHDNEFDEDNTCQLRRTLSANGKSKCYINGIPTTVSNTKTIGEMLVDIHGQHAHQSLTATDKQLALLDNFSNHSELLTSVKSAYKAWQALLKQQQKLQQGGENLTDKYDLLHYQLEELTNSNIGENEFTELAEQQKYLSSGQEIIQLSESLQTDTDSLQSQFGHLLTTADKIAGLDSRFAEVNDLLHQAEIYVDEASSSLNHYVSSLETDPDALQQIETRMSELHDLARKHRVEPSELNELQANFSDQLAELEQTIEQLKTIDQDIIKAEKVYRSAADKLSQSRQQSAEKLCVAIHEQLSQLSLENARFRIEFQTVSAKSNGTDSITFMFAPNPGQGEKPLHKIASGGELSRISLAIQVASVANKSDATLIFDEVDSGIGGATAEVVGRLLKTLSQYNQVICVTHLAQVAAFADQHIKISKQVIDEETFTDFHILTDKERIDELARMSGGIKKDKKTLEHAKNLFDNAIQFTQTLKNI